MPDILLVEDNDISLKFLSNLLSRAGFTFDIATNGAHAIERLDRGQYKLVLMDTFMPIMNGFEAVACIRGNPRNVALPIVGLATTSAEADRCRAAQCDDVIMKPYAKANALAIINALLPKAQLEAAAKSVQEKTPLGAAVIAAG